MSPEKCARMKASRSPFRPTPSRKTGTRALRLCAAFLCAAVVDVAGAGCGGPQLVIVLKPGDDLGNAPPLHIKVVMGDGKADPITNGPFDTDGIPDSIFE